MSTLSLHLQLRNARRSKGLSQAELARQVECTQSAVSMMEGGKVDALARATLEKIASLLGVELPEEAVAEETKEPVKEALVEAPAYRICPNAECISNMPYRVGEEVFFLPKAHQVAGNRCPFCGEVLVGVCPECGAPIHAHGACCTECGAALVPSVMEPERMSEKWLEMRQQQASLVMRWTAGA